MPTDTFRTADGIAVPAVTTDEMREVDRFAIEEFGVELLQMMENAGRNLACVVRETLQSPATDERPVVVVAGNGGNGGGGLACARHLYNRDVPVEVVLDRPLANLDGAAATQAAVLDAVGVLFRTAAADIGDPSVVVDALVGYGLSGPLRSPADELVAVTNATDAPVVSLDVPSGRDATTGDTYGDAVRPDRLLTLALPKTGLDAVGCPLFLGDIAIPPMVYDRIDLDYTVPFDGRYVVELVTT